MAKGSGTTRGKGPTRSGGFEFSRDDLITYSIEKPGQNLSKSDYYERLEKEGIGRADIDTAFDLILAHTGDRAEQDKADAQIEEALDNNTNIGKALKAISGIETDYFKQWKRAYSERKELADEITAKTGNAYNVQRDMMIYRSGGNRRIESWTRLERGADIGKGVVLAPERSATINDMLKDYYVLGGIARRIGKYAGESEVLLVRKKR